MLAFSVSLPGRPAAHTVAAKAPLLAWSRLSTLGSLAQLVRRAKAARLGHHAVVAACHCGFAVLLVTMLLGRWWVGGALVQCGGPGEPYVAEHCTCGGTLPWICWISECINGTWGESGGRDRGAVLRARLWTGLGLLPALASAWLLRHRQRPLDWALALLGLGYLLVGLVPDTLQGAGRVAHSCIAAAALFGPFAIQLWLPALARCFTLAVYVATYVAISESIALSGASRRWVYDWSFTVGTVPSSFVPVILEWVAAFGAVGVAVAYCVCEELRLRRQAALPAGELCAPSAAAWGPTSLDA